MPSLERPCFLLPHGSERSTVYACVPVDRDLAFKSPVIETLMEYEGLVDMPEGVSLEDFEAWSTIVTQQPSTLSLDDLSFALQVGEKLSAHNVSELTQALAARLKAFRWTTHTDPSPMLRALLPLNKNLQQLIFSHLGKISAPAIFKWPLPLQQAYADRWVSPVHGSSTKSFVIAKEHPPASVLRFLELLSRTDPSLPGLTSLDLDCPIPTPEAASLLSSALLHHTALAELDMPQLSWEPSSESTPAATVFRTLPHLTAITSLTLSAPSLPPLPPQPSAAEAVIHALQAMASAISALPLLSQFHLTTIENTTGGTSPAKTLPPPTKRRKVASSMGSSWIAIKQPSLEPIIAALSCAPALTSLILSVPACNLGQPLASSGPFSSLQRLSYNVSEGIEGGLRQGDHSIETGVLSSVPLPALTALWFSSASPEVAAHSACIRSIMAHASSQPALEHVSMDLVANDKALRPDASFCFCVDDGATGRDLSLDIAPCLTASVAEALRAGLFSLAARDALYIILGSEAVDESGEHLLQGIENIQPVLQCLQSFTRLQTLQFSVDLTPSQYGSKVEDVCSAFLAAPLPSMTRMTHLILELPAACGFQLPQVSRFLTEMTQLRNLSLQHFDNVGVHEFEACFAPLTALTSLFVSVRPVTADLLQSFASVVRRNLSLDSSWIGSGVCSGCNAAGSEEGQAAVQGSWDSWCQVFLSLPPRGRCHMPLSTLASESEVEALMQQLAARGAHVQKYSSSLDIDFRKSSKPAM